MIPLTNKNLESYANQKTVTVPTKVKKYGKVRDHCHSLSAEV